MEDYDQLADFVAYWGGSHIERPGVSLRIYKPPVDSDIYSVPRIMPCLLLEQASGRAREPFGRPTSRLSLGSKFRLGQDAKSTIHEA